MAQVAPRLQRLIPPWRGGLLLASLGLALGCGSRVSDTPVPFEPETPGSGTPAEAPFDASGRFAAERVVALEVKNPDTAHLVTDPSEDWFTQQTFMYLLGEWEEGPDGAVSIVEETCHIDISVIGGVDTLPGEGLLASLVPVRIQATLAAPEVWADFDSDPYPDVWGAQLDDPLADPLPQEPEDPSQWDQDGDGEPGVTIYLDVVDSDIRWTTYVAQRVVFSLEGAPTSADEVSGVVRVRSAEQVLLDASPAWLNATRPEVRPSPDASLSYFRAVRVDGELSCADLARKGIRDQLFGRAD